MDHRRPNRLDALISKLELLHRAQLQRRSGAHGNRASWASAGPCVALLLASLFVLCSAAAGHVRVVLLRLLGGGVEDTGARFHTLPAQIQALPPPAGGEVALAQARQANAHSGVPIVSLFVHDALAAQITRSLPTLAFALSSLLGARAPAPHFANFAPGVCFWAAAAATSALWLSRFFC